MTLKRLLLTILTILAIAVTGLSLAESWNQPQIQSRLELYQTNLVLQASEWQGELPVASSTQSGLKVFLGNQPLEDVTKQYQEARKTAADDRDRFQNLSPISNQKLTQLIAELDLRLGILQAHQGQLNAAQQHWVNVKQPDNTHLDSSLEAADTPLRAIANTADVLGDLWRDPPRSSTEAEALLEANLDDWFRYRALSQLYEVQGRSQQLATLKALEQADAQTALSKLVLLGGLPLLGVILGTGLLIFLAIQWFLKRGESLLSKTIDTWTVTWDWEIVWQVFIVGFFWVGQVLVPRLLLPLIFGATGLNPALFSPFSRALWILISYLLVALGGILTLYFSIKPFFPLSKEWFRFNLRGNWFWWGFGGYLTALPLVILVSLANQQIWGGRGGSNPILPIALESRDNLAIACFFFTASFAAPLFEEILFRGFLLPSLNRYFPVWVSISLSSILFAVAHLSLSEILPLATLGMVLAVVYWRSSNLLAPMLLHSLWNTGTMLSLLVLGSGNH